MSVVFMFKDHYTKYVHPSKQAYRHKYKRKNTFPSTYHTFNFSTVGTKYIIAFGLRCLNLSLCLCYLSNCMCMLPICLYVYVTYLPVCVCYLSACMCMLPTCLHVYVTYLPVCVCYLSACMCWLCLDYLSFHMHSWCLYITLFFSVYYMLVK